MHLHLFNNQPHHKGGNQVEESRGLTQSQRQDSTGPWPHTVSAPGLMLLDRASPGTPHHVSKGPAHWYLYFLVFSSYSYLGWREWAIQVTLGNAGLLGFPGEVSIFNGHRIWGLIASWLPFMLFLLLGRGEDGRESRCFSFLCFAPFVTWPERCWYKKPWSIGSPGFLEKGSTP